MGVETESASDRLAKREVERAEREAKRREAWAERRLVDLDALEALELERDPSNVCHQDVDAPDLPTLVAARCPTDPEVKRYQARVRPQADGSEGDAVKAAQEIAAACRVYPDAETYAKILAVRPGVSVQLGVKTIKLAAGRVSAEGKG